MTTAEAQTWMARPSKPKFALPPGACDAHVHVFGPGARFPYEAGRASMPSDAPKEALFALHAFLGIKRCIIVHTAAHGFDNAATADALKAKGSSYRGIALVPTTISESDLKALDDVGFRGARFHYMQHLKRAAPIEDVIAFGERLADIGWHLQIHTEADLIAELASAIRRSAVPVVIDHMGRVDASLGLAHAHFQTLLRLLDDPNVWVKVSGADRITRLGPPYADAAPFARKLLDVAGDRVVWGLDWPHPNHQGPIPDDGELVDLLTEIAPGERARRAVLVDNPTRLYRFGTATEETPGRERDARSPSG